MAQQGPSFTDKHIEKVFLAVGGLILLITIFAYGLGGGRTVEIRGQEVAAGDADIMLAEEAKRLVKRVEDDTNVPPEPKPTGLKEAIAADQETPLAWVGIGTILGEPLRRQPGPATIVPPAPVSVAELRAAMPAPAVPEAIQKDELKVTEETVSLDDGETKPGGRINLYQPAYRPTPSRTPTRRTGLEVVLNEDKTIHLVSTYDWNELRDKWMEVLSSTVVVPEIAALALEVQVQSRPLGSDQWQDDGTVSVTRRPTAIQGLNRAAGRVASRQFQVFTLPALPDFTGENALEVKEAVRTVAQPAVQSWVLQPDYWDIWLEEGRQHWTSLLDMAKIEELYKVEQPATTAGTPAAAVTSAMPVGWDPSMGAPYDIVVTPGRRGRGGNAGGVPDITYQLARGKVLLFAHVTNLEYGREYRCRMRLEAANPLLASPDSAKPVSDAKVKTVQSPWSDWSNPVSVEREVQFFLTGVNRHQDTVSVTAFATVLGQRVRRTIGGVTPGRLIADRGAVSIVDPTRVGTARSRGSRGAVAPVMEPEFMGEPPMPPFMDPTNPMFDPQMAGGRPTARTARRDRDREREREQEALYVGEGAVTKKDVDFDTGAIALELSFDKRVRSTLGTTQDDGVEMVYLDANGELATRVMSYDEALQRPLESEARLVLQRVTPPRRRPAERDRRIRMGDGPYGTDLRGTAGTAGTDPRGRTSRDGGSSSGSSSDSGRRSSRMDDVTSGSGRTGDRPGGTGGAWVDPRSETRDRGSSNP